MRYVTIIVVLCCLFNCINAKDEYSFLETDMGEEMSEQEWMKARETEALAGEETAKQALQQAQIQQQKLQLQQQVEDAQKEKDRQRQRGQALQQQLKQAMRESAQQVEQTARARMDENKSKERATKRIEMQRTRKVLKQLRRYGKRFALISNKEIRAFLKRFPKTFKKLKKFTKWIKGRHMYRAKNGSLVMCPSSFNNRARRDAALSAWMSAVVHAPNTFGGSVPTQGNSLPLPKAIEEFTNAATPLGLTVIKGMTFASPRFAFLGYRAPYFIAKSDVTKTIYVAFIPHYNAALRPFDWARAGGIKYQWSKLDIDGFYYGHVHKGFLSLWGKSGRTIINDIKALRANGTNTAHYKISFSGFGEAGAMAQLFALETSVRLKIKTSVFTFGSSRVGNSRFARWMEHATEHYRFVFKNDMFAELPAYSFRFKRGARYFSIPGKHNAFIHGDRVAIQLMSEYDNNGKNIFNCFDESVPNKFASIKHHHALRYLMSVLNMPSAFLPNGISHYQFCYPNGTSASTFPEAVRPYLPPVLRSLTSCPTTNGNSTIACLPPRVRQMFRPEFSGLIPQSIFSLPVCPSNNMYPAIRPKVVAAARKTQNPNTIVFNETLANPYSQSEGYQPMTPEQEQRNKAEWKNKSPEERRKRQRKQQERRRKYVRTVQEKERKQYRESETKKQQQQHKEEVDKLQQQQQKERKEREEKEQDNVKKLQQAAEFATKSNINSNAAQEKLAKAEKRLQQVKELNEMREQALQQKLQQQQQTQQELAQKQAQKQQQNNLPEADAELKRDRIRRLSNQASERLGKIIDGDEILYAPCIPSSVSVKDLPERVRNLPLIRDMPPCPPLTKPCLPEGITFPAEVRDDVPAALSDLPICNSSGFGLAQKKLNRK